jgi:hypothetical protein
LESQNQRLIKDGNTLQSADENLKELTVQAQSFFQKTHPILLALGV